MGLTVAIGNALAGLKANQGSLEVLSRNISNAGTPGYHKQSLNVIEVGRGDNSYVRVGQVSRAFDQTLQNYYTRQLPDSGYASTRANFLDRLQTYLGKPGSAGALDTSFGSLQSALDAARDRQGDIPPLDSLHPGDDGRHFRFYVNAVIDQSDEAPEEAAIVYAVEITEQKALELSQKVAPYQVLLGLIGLASAFIYLLFRFNVLHVHG